jgi:hypothetical protein
MKRNTPSLIVWALTCVGLCAQGTINCPDCVHVTNMATMQLVGTAFRGSIHYLPDTGTTPTVSDFDAQGVVVSAFTFLGSGIVCSGTQPTPPATPPRDFAWFQLRVWESAFGSTYEQAAAYAGGSPLPLIGTSSIVRMRTGDPLGFPPVPPGTWPCMNFGVYPVPEPTVVALALLAGVSLSWVRRRR